ncbi:Hsp20/alpha crystallin family protein [Agrilactobacillus fermenti]|uniref:Hsp20/alpha crystallin family protein n=1 Tax=Agrilactobacillus fermenti TaxID=2586909 RepID=UPI001E32700A|nr:Hsp20/alpha crystallin family protein [Agrilactobacillus fermenti]MCD2257049.1 Hsp20/alpha crystallin family protein [Agrilactobacillus fermenti]
MANEVQRRRNYDWGLDPFFDNLQHRFLDSMFPEDMNQNLKTDIQETDKSYICEVDLPGVEKNDIHMNYNDGILNINAKKQSFVDHDDKNGNMMLSERSYGALSRSYRLPNVDASKIKAEFNNGVLKVTLPKLTEIQNGSNIDIQ